MFIEIVGKKHNQAKREIDCACLHGKQQIRG